jgi:nucleoporin NUP82
MASVLSHTPSWLSAPHAGFNVFQPTPGSKSSGAMRSAKDKTDYRGPMRTIAHRGTEVFVLVGSEIRWSDLVMLRDTPEDSDQQSYRVRRIMTNKEGAYSY